MLKQIAWSVVKASVEAWLRTRAMVIPVSRRGEIARRFGVGEDVVVGINALLIDQALSQLDFFKP